MVTLGTTVDTAALYPYVIAINSAYCAHALNEAVVAGFSADAALAIDVIVMNCRLSAGRADTLGAVADMFTFLCLKAKSQGAVGILEEDEGNHLTLGNKELAAAVGTACIVEVDGVNTRDIALCHIEALVVSTLDSNVAVLSKHGCKLAILKFIDSDICKIAAVAVLCSVDITEEIVVRLGL